MNGRVELCNSVPTYILTVAKRITDTQVFAIPPQQSDYVTLWNTPPTEPRLISDSSSPTNLPSTLPGWRRLVPNTVKRIGRGALRRLLPAPPKPRYEPQGFARPCYRRVDENDLLRGNLHGNVAI